MASEDGIEDEVANESQPRAEIALNGSQLSKNHRATVAFERTY